MNDIACDANTNEPALCVFDGVVSSITVQGIVTRRENSVNPLYESVPCAQGVTTKLHGKVVTPCLFFELPWQNNGPYAVTYSRIEHGFQVEFAGDKTKPSRLCVNAKTATEGEICEKGEGRIIPIKSRAKGSASATLEFASDQTNELTLSGEFPGSAIDTVEIQGAHGIIHCGLGDARSLDGNTLAFDAKENHQKLRATSVRYGADELHVTLCGLQEAHLPSRFNLWIHKYGWHIAAIIIVLVVLALLTSKRRKKARAEEKPRAEERAARTKQEKPEPNRDLGPPTGAPMAPSRIEAPPSIEAPPPHQMPRKSSIEASIPIHILIVEADNVSASQRLDVSKEIREIRTHVKQSKYGHLILVDDVRATLPTELREGVSNVSPTILHFSGHANTSGIWIRVEGETPHLVQKEQLRQWLTNRKIWLVVLNACYTHEVAEELKAVVPNVIGTSIAVNDRAAIAFSQGFYKALGNGLKISHAVREGIDNARLLNYANVHQSLLTDDSTLLEYIAINTPTKDAASNLDKQ